MKQLFIIKLLKFSIINMKRRLRNHAFMTSKRKGDHVFCHVFVDFIVFKQ